MTSPKQIEANRRNALRSTGPRTTEGKQSSRANAYRHGLTAETVVTTLEDAEDYGAFQIAVASGYDAQTTIERELVLRLASLLWRLRRATAIETALFGLAGRSSTENGGNRLHRSVAGRDAAISGGGQIAEYFLQLMELPTCPLDRLSRYEHTLWRQARQIIVVLQTLTGQPQPHARFRFSRWSAVEQSHDEVG